MKRFRVFLVTATLVSAMIVGSAPPASANCVDVANACALVCQVGTGNKYTEPLFRFCYVW